MIEVCITGIPGTGKSTACDILTLQGYKCMHLDSLSEELGCIDRGVVDVDCLNGKYSGSCDFAESHYSHMLNCRKVVILECSPDTLRNRIQDRGYSEAKIAENLESQDSDIIYQEALDRHPAGRIFRIAIDALSPEEVAARLESVLRST